jgi:hypothetical protein
VLALPLLFRVADLFRPGLGEEFGQLVGVTPTEYLRYRLDGFR